LETTAFSTVTPDPIIANNFFTLRVTSPDGKQKETLNNPPNVSGTLPVLQRGH